MVAVSVAVPYRPLVMQIRPATVEDVPQVLPMVRAIARFHQNLDPAKYHFRDDPGKLYENWLTRNTADERAVFLVADVAARHESPRLVGFVVGTVEPEIGIYQLREYGFIHDLWVDEAYRNEGVGRQLAAEAVGRFADIGVKQIRLDVLVGNEPARKLFERCGFRATVTEMMIEPVAVEVEVSHE